MKANGGTRSADEPSGDDLERLEWLSVRLQELSSRISLLDFGRPYRDTARRQTLKRIRVQLRTVERRLSTLRRSLDEHPGDRRLRGQLRLLLAVAGLLAAARSALELVGLGRRWSREQTLEKAGLVEDLTRSRGLERRVRQLQGSLDEIQRALDAAGPVGPGASTTGTRSPRTEAWLALAETAVSLARGWLQRVDVAAPGSGLSPRSTAWRVWAVAGLEAQTDYMAVLAAAAEILCRM
ncbi:MAG: hypothetical protein ACR2LY_01810 [Thermoleophilaceae bacterium]